MKLIHFYYFNALLSILLSPSSWALEAVVVATQSPLYLSESEQGEISEYRLKGNIVFIHGFYNTELKSFKDNELGMTKFYKSLDRIGRPVFIRSEDVFVYFEDEREIDSLQ